MLAPCSLVLLVMLRAMERAETDCRAYEQFKTCTTHKELEHLNSRLKLHNKFSATAEAPLSADECASRLQPSLCYWSAWLHARLLAAAFISAPTSTMRQSKSSDCAVAGVPWSSAQYELQLSDSSLTHIPLSSSSVGIVSSLSRLRKNTWRPCHHKTLRSHGL